LDGLGASFAHELIKPQSPWNVCTVLQRREENGEGGCILDSLRGSLSNIWPVTSASRFLRDGKALTA
jgi:hypothetical protein